MLNPRLNSIAEVTMRAQERWKANERIKRTDVELISAERLETPLTGDHISDRWNNNFQTVG